MRVRIVQFEITDLVEENCDKAIALARAGETDVIIFPEMFICGFDNPNHIEEIAIPIEEFLVSGGFFLPFKEICRDLDCHLILGSLPLREREGLFNTSLVISPSGKIIHRYDKRHLFPLMDESRIFSPGLTEDHQQKFVFPIEGFSGLVKICYDLRFPEVFRNLEAGIYPDVIFLPMQWPAPRTEIFRNLSRSRAIENQAYTVVCNRVGKDRNNTYEGGSLLAGPDGTILAEMDDQEGYRDVELDIGWIREFRSRFPFLKNHQSSEKKSIETQSY